jgi:hypothetical protein
MSTGYKRSTVKELLTRREMLSEVVSKDTLKQVAKAWYGFTAPISEASGILKKPESLLDKVRKTDAKYTKHIRKEG